MALSGSISYKLSGLWGWADDDDEEEEEEGGNVLWGVVGCEDDEDVLREEGGPELNMTSLMSVFLNVCLSVVNSCCGKASQFTSAW